MTITGTSGSLTAMTTITLTVNPLGNFTLTAMPGSVTIARGSSGTATITVIPKDAFDQSVTLIRERPAKRSDCVFLPERYYFH